MPNFRRHLSFAFLFFFFFLFLQNYHLKKSLYVKLKDRMSNSVDLDETAHMSRLIWIYAVCKGLLLLPVVVKELSPLIYSDEVLYFSYVRYANMLFFFNCLFNIFSSFCDFVIVGNFNNTVLLCPFFTKVKTP